MSDTVSVSYKKENDAKKITLVLESKESMNLLDVLHAFSSVMTQILATGKY